MVRIMLFEAADGSSLCAIMVFFVVHDAREQAVKHVHFSITFRHKIDRSPEKVPRARTRPVIYALQSRGKERVGISSLVYASQLTGFFLYRAHDGAIDHADKEIPIRESDSTALLSPVSGNFHLARIFTHPLDEKLLTDCRRSHIFV